MGCTNLFFLQTTTTPILTFPRQTGEGTRLLIRQRGRLKIRILDFRRPHSISFNNSKHPTCRYLLPCFSTSAATCPLSRLAGEGWGEGGSTGCTNLIFPSHKATPILTFPRQTGEGTELLINQRGRLKIRILDFRRPHSISFNNSKHPTCHYLLPYFSTSTATCPLSRLAGEGWGEGGSMGCTNLIFPSHKATPILTFPRRTGGRDRIADTAKRSSENYDL